MLTKTNLREADQKVNKHEDTLKKFSVNRIFITIFVTLVLVSFNVTAFDLDNVLH